MPKGVYERKPRATAVPGLPVVVKPQRRNKKADMSKAQARAMLKMANTQLHALAMNMALITEVLGSDDD